MGRCEFIDCVDYNGLDCKGDLIPYFTENGMFFRCTDHTKKHMLKMSVWGTYTVPTLPS